MYPNQLALELFLRHVLEERARQEWLAIVHFPRDLELLVARIFANNEIRVQAIKLPNATLIEVDPYELIVNDLEAEIELFVKFAYLWHESGTADVRTTLEFALCRCHLFYTLLIDFVDRLFDYIHVGKRHLLRLRSTNNHHYMHDPEGKHSEHFLLGIVHELFSRGHASLTSVAFAEHRVLRV